MLTPNTILCAAATSSRYFLPGLLLLFFLVPIRSFGSAEDCSRLIWAPLALSSEAEKILPAAHDIFVATIHLQEATDTLPGEINIDRTLYFEENLSSFVNWANQAGNLEASSPELLIMLLERAAVLLSKISPDSDYWNLGVKVRPWLRQELRLATVRLLDETLMRKKSLDAVRDSLEQYLKFLYGALKHKPADSEIQIWRSESMAAIEDLLEWRGTRARTIDDADLDPKVVPFRPRPRL